jgi:hypothetical protein
MEGPTVSMVGSAVQVPSRGMRAGISRPCDGGRSLPIDVM